MAGPWEWTTASWIARLDFRWRRDDGIAALWVRRMSPVMARLRSAGLARLRPLIGEHRKSPALGQTDAIDPKETSLIPSLDDHKCYSFALKCRADVGAGVRCEAEKQGRI
jgi:hypothetical protein